MSDFPGNPFAEKRGFKSVSRPVDMRASWANASSPNWAIEGLLQFGNLTIVSAPTGLGKSLLQQVGFTDLALLRSLFLDRFPLTSRKLNIGVLESENGQARIGRRYRELVLGGQYTPDEVNEACELIDWYTLESIEHPELVLEELRELIEAHGWDVVALDPLRPFLPADVEDETQAIQMGRVIDGVQKVANETGAAVWMSGHDTKAGGAVRGAGTQQDSAPFVLHLTPGKGDVVNLTAIKQRDYAVCSRAAYIISKSSTPTVIGEDTFWPVSLGGCDPDEDEGEKTNPLDPMIVSVVKTHYDRTQAGMSLQKCADAINEINPEHGANKDRVRHRIPHLKRDGLIYQPSGGSLYPPNAKPEIAK